MTPPRPSTPRPGFLATRVVLAAAMLLASAPTTASAQDAETFPIRAVHLDNRIQVAPLGELLRLATWLSERGINAIIMEWEASFPFKKHAVIPNRYAYTPTEIAAFIAHCDSVGIQVIPLQQCIGHLEYVLRHERYAHLRESNADISQACPSNKRPVVSLYDDLLEELVAAHPSKYVHIGADETALLGHCDACRKVVQREGKSGLFMDHIASIAECVRQHGKTPLLWADIVMRHPEAIDKLPKDCVLVNWNYGWDVNHFGNHQALQDSGLELWGALAMRSHPDNFFRSAWDTHFRNLEDFLPFMRAQGYRGVVLTSWSTSGVYWQLREPKSHVVDLIPNRRVYPMRGFPLLLDAFANAIRVQDFSAAQYVEEYCQQHYGIDQSQAESFWDLLSGDSDLPIGDASTRPLLLAARARTVAFLEFLRDARPGNGYEEHFAHYLLMNDIRLFYIDVQLARLDAEELSTDRDAPAPLLERLTELRHIAENLNTRFAALHHDNLYPGAIDEENEARTQELEALYRRVAKQR